MARSKTSAATARKLRNQEQALALRRAGHSFERIGHKIGISTSRAHALVQMGLATARDQITASVDELRTEELSRLDGMLAKLYPKAEKGDLYAADRVLKIGERRARLLGLDAPVRTALEGGGEGAPPVSHVATVTFYMPENGRG
jgi:hypothetical protein